MLGPSATETGTITLDDLTAAGRTTEVENKDENPAPGDSRWP
jgi:hypothetical protein